MQSDNKGAMPIRLFKTAWGQVGADAHYKTLASFIHSAAEEGYAGVEFPLAYMALEEGRLEAVQEELLALIARLDLDYIALIATRPKLWSDEAGHRQDFCLQLEQAVDMKVKNAAVHAGSDGFAHSQAVSFLRDCQMMAKDRGVDACFETHRGRPLCNPFRTAEILNYLPDLRLTSDLSHWMVVIDRLPDDCFDLFIEASRRSGHIHARVGYEKGAQVPEPRDPIWSHHIEFYRQCWQETIEAAQKRGEVMTVSPEFGPPPYMNALPYSQQPVADIKEINDWMRDQLKMWFNSAP